MIVAVGQLKNSVDEFHLNINIVTGFTMAHTRWVNPKKTARQAGPKWSLRLDDGRITEREGVGQTVPSLEASDAAAADAPAADGSFGGVIGRRDVLLPEEKTIGTPVVAQAEQEFLQARQGEHVLLI